MQDMPHPEHHGTLYCVILGIFGAWRADVTGSVHERRHFEGFVLPEPVESDSLTVAKVGIWWMPDISDLAREVIVTCEFA
jgi:hypothetical protein